MRTGARNETVVKRGRDVDRMVAGVVARHLDLAPGAITAWTDLGRDLELDPLDLALIALRIEEMEGTEFPLSRLDGVSSIAHIASIVRDMRAEKARKRASGEHAIGHGIRVLRLAVGH